MASSSTQGGFLKELLVISGLAGTQVVAAVYTVVLKRVLSLGVDPLLIVILGNFIQGVFVLAFAVPFERNKWPERLTPVLMGQFLLIGFGGVTAFQGLLMYGIRNTSPAIASAMPNLTPGLVFLIAACFGFEKFEMRCNYTRAKVLGTLVCLSGALSLSFLQNPPSTQNGNRTGKSNYQDWIIGYICLLSAVVSLSCSIVLQAATMINFHAPFSLCAITSLIGATLTALMQIVTNGKLEVGSPTISMTSIIIFALTVLPGWIDSKSQYVVSNLVCQSERSSYGFHILPHSNHNFGSSYGCSPRGIHQLSKLCWHACDVYWPLHCLMGEEKGMFCLRW